MTQQSTAPTPFRCGSLSILITDLYDAGKMMMLDVEKITSRHVWVMSGIGKSTGGVSVDVCIMWWIADGSCFIRGSSSSQCRRQHLLESSLDTSASSTDWRVPRRPWLAMDCSLAAAEWMRFDRELFVLISALYARRCYLLCTAASPTVMQIWLPVWSPQWAMLPDINQW